MEGMIVKTGLQDATKNVRIYGTISAASDPQPPAWITQPPLPFSRPPSCLALSGLLAKSSLSLSPPPRFFFTSSCRRFPECAAWRGGRGRGGGGGGGRSYFSCFSLLLSLRGGAAPPRVFPRLTSPSPSPSRFFLCRLLYPTTFSPDPYPKQPLPTIGSHRLAGGSFPHFCGATLMLH